ncbi:hypothetical protein KEM55_003943 [Ascosphaera atra]|nr:hypothetical protein KEM55_003943 [Ascosphaera atra]
MGNWQRATRAASEEMWAAFMNLSLLMLHAVNIPTMADAVDVRFIDLPGFPVINPDDSAMWLASGFHIATSPGGTARIDSAVLGQPRLPFGSPPPVPADGALTFEDVQPPMLTTWVQ